MDTEVRTIVLDPKRSITTKKKLREKKFETILFGDIKEIRPPEQKKK